VRRKQSLDLIFDALRRVLYDISQLLNTHLDRNQLATCVAMIENGVNPEALAVCTFCYNVLACVNSMIRQSSRTFDEMVPVRSLQPVDPAGQTRRINFLIGRVSLREAYEKLFICSRNARAG